jgi:ParB/RepB/Spo0J family partition protein
MEVCNVDINKLYVSSINVRKTLSSEDDESNINDLACDIITNGLINPITVRVNNDKYEIIAGQRRYLAMKQLNKDTIPCNIINVTTQKAEEISLVENVQRNQMTTSDKVRSYSKLYEVYNGDIEKVISAIHISKQTIQKYLKISNLPDQILSLLDAGTNNEHKISLDVAVELTKISNNISSIDVLNKLTTLTNLQKINAIKEFNLNGDDDIDELDNIKEYIAIKENHIILAPSYPYVFDSILKKNVRIPESLFEEIVNLIKHKTGNNLIYC